MLTCTASGCEGFLVFEKHTVAEVADRGLVTQPSKHLDTGNGEKHFRSSDFVQF
jgi:hypothetical protein